MNSQSNPERFGDVEAPTPIQDANAFLSETLRLIRIDRGIGVADMSREVLGVLAENDGMTRKDLWEAVYESLETRLLPRGPISCAIDELAKRGVLNVDDGSPTRSDWRYSLNPAVAALIGRDAA